MAQHNAATVVIIDSDDEAPAPSNIRLSMQSGQTIGEAISLTDSDDDDEPLLAPARKGAQRPSPAAPHTTPVYRKSPAMNRPANSLFIGAQPQAQQQPISANIPLPNFHQAPAPKPKPTAKPAAQKTNLARRPHPQGSQGSGSPDRKRLRLEDIRAYRAPSSGGLNYKSVAMNQNASASPAALPHVQQAVVDRGASNQNNPSPPVHMRTLERESNTSEPQRVVAMSAEIKRNSVVVEEDNFPLVSQIGKTRLEHISADVHATMNDTIKVGDRTIYRILKKSLSLSGLASQIMANLTDSPNQTLSRTVKTKFEASFQGLQQEYVDFDISESRKDKWISATVCDGIAICGKMPNEAQPIPDPTSLSAIGSPVSGVNDFLPSIEETQEHIGIIGRQTPRKRAATYIKKYEHYRDVDVLRYKGMKDLEQRPYIATKDLQIIQSGAKRSATKLLSAKNARLVSVPFVEDEIAATRETVWAWYKEAERTDQELDGAARGSQNSQFLGSIASYIANNTAFTTRRTKEAYQEFLKEAPSIVKFLRDQKELDQSEPTALIKKRKLEPSDDSLSNAYKIQRLWRHRETGPNVERATQQLQSLLLHQLDDSFTRDAEFSGGPGDIANLVWLSEDDFISGALTNGDLYNQDYNKPGNMVIGSAKTKVARAIIGHRIPRPPKPQKDDNAAVDSQDPWLYLSVPMTAYDADKGLCFTASYDKTVQIWRASPANQSMELLATWPHNGPVNFVLTSPQHNKVATGSDVSRDGIRVYDLDEGDLEALIPSIYSGSKANDCASRYTTWAYHPATMQWGLCEGASHFLLVGYSSRALDVQSHVPCERRHSGQICVWDTRTKTEVTIRGPKTQNSFEVAWHPSQVVFVSATAATGEYDEDVKTQLRLFVYKDSTNVFHVVRTFECYGADINEITLRPSSFREFYLTASCTNGKTYVWESAQGNYPIHELCHDAAIDQLDENHDAEDVDAGVKFAAWGRTVDRFYTGSSDGAVKVWNIRMPPGEAFIEDILFAPGGISCGLFSPDRTRLAVGDTSGKIHLMKIWDKEFDPKPVYTRTAIRPFYEPAPPISGGVEKAREFVAKQQILIHPDPYIGAVQGPRYPSTNLYRHEKAIRRDLSAIPDEVLNGQRARKHAEALVLPRLPSIKGLDFHQVHVSDILEKLLGRHFSREEARKFTHFCVQMHASLPDLVELARAEVDFDHEIEDDYQEEPEVADVFKRKSMGGLTLFGVDKKAYYLSESEIQQFQNLRRLISNESLTRAALYELSRAEGVAMKA